jgi:hypothetical protein
LRSTHGKSGEPRDAAVGRGGAVCAVAGVALAAIVCVAAGSAAGAGQQGAPAWRELVRVKWGDGSREVGAREVAGRGLLGPLCLTADTLGSSRVLVADWANGRVQLWNHNGEFVGSRALPDIGLVVDIAVTQDDRVYVTNGQDIACQEADGPQLLSARNLLPGATISLGVLRDYRKNPRAVIYLEQDGAVGYLGQDDLNWIRVYEYADGFELVGASRGRDLCVSPRDWGKCYTLIAPGLKEQPVRQVRVAAAESDELETDILEFLLPSQSWEAHHARLVGVRGTSLDRFYVLMSADGDDARRAALIQYDRRAGGLIEQITLPASAPAGGPYIGDLQSRLVVDGGRFCYLACSDPEGYTILQAQFRDKL